MPLMMFSGCLAAVSWYVSLIGLSDGKLWALTLAMASELVFGLLSVYWACYWLPQFGKSGMWAFEAMPLIGFAYCAVSLAWHLGMLWILITTPGQS